MPHSPDTLTIRTARLLLRPLRPCDLFPLAEAANDAEVSRWLLTLPHPYEVGHAAKGIVRSREQVASGKGISLGVFLARPLVGADGAQHAAGTLVGMIGLRIDFPAEHRAELGYWVGALYRRCGVASEAARAVVEFGFDQAGLRRIYATHFLGNEASPRVMAACGMRHEGLVRGAALKRGELLDAEMWGVAR